MLTEMEMKVYKDIIDNTQYDVSTEASDISEGTGIPMKYLRGVLASLIKKNLVEEVLVEGGPRDFYAFCPLDEKGMGFYFWGDQYTEEEFHYITHYDTLFLEEV